MTRALHRSPILLLLALSTSAAAQTSRIELISRVHPRHVSDTGMGGSEAQAISADGRYFVFQSEAPNLVPGQIDDNLGSDVFVHDRVTGTTELVSRSTGSSPTTTGNFSSSEAAISGDGRYVVFTSLAEDLVPGQQDYEDLLSDDVFLFDRITGTMELVSHTSSSRTVTLSDDSRQPAISADGRFVAFTSSSNLYLYERSSGKNTLIHPGHSPALSADGRFVAFRNTAEGPRLEVLLYDRTSKKITAISRATPPAPAGNASLPRRPAISADGSVVVFDSTAANVVPGQTGPAGRSNVFLFHRPTGKTSLVSHASSSLTASGDGDAGSFAVNADGSFVAFASLANDHVSRQAGRGRKTSDVFLYSRATGRITLVSGAGGSATVPANGSSGVRGISADGNLVLFQSTAKDVVRGTADPNGATDVFLYDRRSGRAVLVSHGAASQTRAANGESLGSILSADGRWVAFQSAATDLTSGTKDFNLRMDVVLDGGAAGRELVSLRAPDLPSDTPPGWSWVESISADGRFVAFGSSASWLVAGQRDTNRAADVFLRDRELGTTILVSRSAYSPSTTGNAGSYRCRISADGKFVVFLSFATDLVPAPAPPDDKVAVFLYERETGRMIRIGAGAVETYYTLHTTPVISADGSFVAFVSTATNLIAGQADSNAEEDVFLYDRAAGTTTLVSRVPGSALTAGNSYSMRPSLSADGRFIAFESAATNLVAGQSEPGSFNTTVDAFLHDRVTGTTVLLSRTAASPKRAAGGEGPVVSADGRFIAFRSAGLNLVPGQVDPSNPRTVDSTFDVFLHDRLTGNNTLVSHAPGSPVRAVGATQPVSFQFGRWPDLDLSADGRFVVFASSAAELIPEQTTPGEVLPQEVFLFDRENGTVSRVSAGIQLSYEPRISADGRFVAFTSELDSYDINEPLFDQNVFLYDRVTGALTQASATRFNSYRFFHSYRKGPYSDGPVLSANGGALAFTSTAWDLIPRDFNVAPPDPDPEFGIYNSSSDAFVYVIRP
jgi:Tol biopolymer transport system component